MFYYYSKILIFEIDAFESILVAEAALSLYADLSHFLIKISFEYSYE